MADDTESRRRWASVGFGVLGGGLVVAAALTLAPWPRIWSLLGQAPLAGRALAVAGLVFLAGSVVIARGWRRSTPVEPVPRPPLRVLPSWLVLVGIAMVALVSAAVTAWLLGEANKATSNQAQARIEAIRTGLTAGAGAGGGIALLLAARRQWLGERTQAHTEDDATERRITELYTKAVDQLGNGKAPVRLGGLYSLERLAQANRDHRQTIVNVLCAYLRMPYPPPATTDPAAPVTTPAPAPSAGAAAPNDDTAGNPARPPAAELATDTREELQVRLTAQRILTAHLHPGADPDHPPGTFWPDIDLDLTGATLVDLDLGGCRLRKAEFDGAQFSGYAGFSGAQFSGYAGFGGAQFSGYAGFSGAQFSGDAGFGGAQFSGYAGFDGAQFSGGAGFEGAQFSGYAGFGGAEFSGAAFGGAQFSGYAGFDDAQFSGNAWFRGAQFSGYAWFRGAQFSGDAGFSGAQFSGDAGFDRAQFSSDAGFGRVRVRLDVPMYTRRVWPAGWKVGPYNTEATDHRPEQWAWLLPENSPTLSEAADNATAGTE